MYALYNFDTFLDLGQYYARPQRSSLPNSQGNRKNSTGEDGADKIVRSHK